MTLHPLLTCRPTASPLSTPTTSCHSPSVLGKHQQIYDTVEQTQKYKEKKNRRVQASESASVFCFFASSSSFGTAHVENFDFVCPGFVPPIQPTTQSPNSRDDPHRFPPAG